MAAHIAVENTLIELRDAGIGVLGPANGFVVNWKDGTRSEIMRLGTRDGLDIGIKAYLAHADMPRYVPAPGYSDGETSWLHSCSFAQDFDADSPPTADTRCSSCGDPEGWRQLYVEATVTRCGICGWPTVKAGDAWQHTDTANSLWETVGGFDHEAVEAVNTDG